MIFTNACLITSDDNKEIISMGTFQNRVNRVRYIKDEAKSISLNFVNDEYQGVDMVKRK